MNLISDVLKAVGQLSDRRFLRVFLLGVGLTIALLAAATVVRIRTLLLGRFLGAKLS